MRQEEYASPFSARYTSPEISRLFSPHFKIATFRKLWVSLAKAEQKLGLSITHQQIAELEDNVERIDFELALAYEKKFKHDVMAHIHAFGDQCPNAKPILHLGATSTFVTDNTDLIQLKAGMGLLLRKLTEVLSKMAKLAENEAATVCLGFTHYQPAQPTTVGKRICLWLQDFLYDALEFERQLKDLPFLGAKGATGTQSSFLALFDGDSAKVKELERLIAHDFGFSKILPIAGQTYTRKIDVSLLNTLASFAASAHKMATDLRLLAHDGEMSEKFEEEQIGSSAMPYKKNPIYAERICGLARFVLSLSQNPAYTLATQWLERSLDDSSNRRFSIPESFLAVDAILNLLDHLAQNLKIDHSAIRENFENKIDALTMETLLMLAVKKGGDRQKLHEKLKKLSGMKQTDLIKALGLDPEEVADFLKPLKLSGRAAEQVRDFLETEVAPFLKKQDRLGGFSFHKVEL
jgi:adenylosuccinate lyase